MEYNLRTRINVRSYELDSMGHVNHSVYANYYEYGRVEYMNKAGLRFDSLIKDNTYPVIVNININYKKSAKLYDELEIRGKFVNVGNTSVTMKQEIVNVDTNQTISDSTSTYVFINGKTEKPIPVPEKFIKAFSLEKLRSNK